MSVLRSPPWERTESKRETKALTPQKMPLHTKNSVSMPRTNLAQSGSNANGTTQSAPISCNNNMRSTLSPWSAESISSHINSPVFSASCVSTTGMPTTTTTNTSTTCSTVSLNSTTTTTASTQLLLATHLSASTQSAALKNQPVVKRARNSPTKVSTLTASNKKIKATSTLNQSKLPNYWLSGTSSANKFAALDVDDGEEITQTANSGQFKDSLSQNLNKDEKEKNNKPPPIYVQGQIMKFAFKQKI
ncbi:uncharacterized protein LOC129250103 [Anastrepha obliqua]|uniref:uncharacterized protein LOC129250103 n=1 Tax=Anastrepha obliqua TaxID=95512 RepID=UPI00240A4E3D|nr:uncharacterized protein LOC129250103 [Anastrepha obliqua]